MSQEVGSLQARPRVLATYAMPARVVGEIQSFADLSILPGESAPERVLENCNGFDALICTLMNKVTADFIDRLPPSIRLVATYSVGIDHIDLRALQARRIALVNTPDVLTEATADIAWLLLLGAARRASEAEALLRSGMWTGWEPNQLVGTDIHGSTLGILGFGRIGRAVARRAAGFGMNILTSVRSSSAGDPPPPGTIICSSMEEVLAGSDFLSLHLPLTEETQNWLNVERIASMKSGAIVINTARGGLIDETALIAALQSGKLGGAGLDVFVGEPDIRRDLVEAPNTFLLPHLGSATRRAREGMGLSLARDIAAFFAGRPVENGVGVSK